MTMMRDQKMRLLLLMCAGMFLVQLDVTVVNVALPHIGAGLGGGLSGMQWVIDAYTVALAALLLAAGVACDRIGDRQVVLLGLAGFGVTSLLCGVAPNLAFLIAARALQGVSAAILLPSTLAVINRAFSQPTEKARALGIWAGVSALALPAGPLIGGGLVSSVGWRWVFLVNVPIVVIGLALAPSLLPPASERKPTPIDVGGLFFAGVTLCALVLAAIEFGASGNRLVSVGSVVVAIASFLAYLVWERHSVHPVIPLGLWRDRQFAGANFVAACMNLVGIGLVFIFTLYLQGIRGDSPLFAGLMMLPLFVPLAVCAPLTGRLVARVGPRPPMLGGLGLGVTGAVSLWFLQPHSPYWVLVLPMAGVGLGMGLLTPSVVTAALTSVPQRLAGLASGVNNTARQAAGALGVAIFGAIVGSPRRPSVFTDGVQRVAVVSVVLWLLALAVTALAVKARVKPSTTTTTTSSRTAPVTPER
jgi:DHA2 family methylenomycin A resistance protein-like MFS transporter